MWIYLPYTRRAITFLWAFNIGCIIDIIGGRGNINWTDFKVHLTLSRQRKTINCIMGSRRVKYDIGSILCRGEWKQEKGTTKSRSLQSGDNGGGAFRSFWEKKNYAIRAVFQCKKSRKIKYRKISKGGKIVSICRLHEIFT